MELFEVLSVPKAKEKLEAHLDQRPVATERVPVLASLGRVLAENIHAKVNVPAFRRSTVDGYAVRAKDTFGATEGLPSLINVVGEVLMGEAATQAVPSLSAVKISTGGMLPSDCDAVVMVEYTEQLDEFTIEISRSVAPGENVIMAGEDIAIGADVLGLGHLLRPQDIGALTGIGVTEVEVYQRPRVAIISTGDEVVAPEQEPGPGQVRDINSYTLAANVNALGGEAILLGIVKDDYDTLFEVVSKAMADYDLVILSGGSSVGTRDATAKVIDNLGEPGTLVHGVSVRPGKPTILGVVDGKPIFGLPGHPVSALVVFELFVQPTLWLKAGLRTPPHQARISARIARNIASGTGREDHVRVVIERREGEVWAVPILGKAGLISTMVKADGLVTIALDKEGVSEGEVVEVRLF